jgi:CHASE2 domain-containing sensor protein
MSDEAHWTDQLAWELVTSISSAVLVGLLGFTLFGGRFTDLYMSLAGPGTASGEVSVVTIGPAALAIWSPAEPAPEVTPRDLLATLITTLDEAGARTIVLDVLLDTPQEGDGALAEAIARHGAVVAAEQVQANQPRSSIGHAKGPSPSIGTIGVTPGVQAAHANLVTEEPVLFTGHQIVRGTLPMMRYERSQLSGSWPESLLTGLPPALTCAPALSLGGAWLHSARKVNPTATLADLVAELCPPPGDPQRSSSQAAAHACDWDETAPVLSCPTDRVSHLPALGVPLHERYPLRFLAPESDLPFPIVPADDLLRARAQQVLEQGLGIPPSPLPIRLVEQLSGRLVYVGRYAAAGGQEADRHATPYSFPFFEDPDTAGVLVQAQLADAMLTGRRLHLLPSWVEGLCTLGAVVLTALSLRRWSRARCVAGWTLAFALATAGGFAWFERSGTVLELGLPIAGSMLALTILRGRE